MPLTCGLFPFMHCNIQTKYALFSLKVPLTVRLISIRTLGFVACNWILYWVRIQFGRWREDYHRMPRSKSLGVAPSMATLLRISNEPYVSDRTISFIHIEENGVACSFVKLGLYFSYEKVWMKDFSSIISDV